MCIFQFSIVSGWHRHDNVACVIFAVRHSSVFGCVALWACQGGRSFDMCGSGLAVACCFGSAGGGQFHLFSGQGGFKLVVVL